MAKLAKSHGEMDKIIPLLSHSGLASTYFEGNRLGWTIKSDVGNQERFMPW